MRLIKYILFDIVRNKVLLIYTALLFLISFGLFSFDTNTTKSLLSILNIVLIVIPLVSIIFSTIYYYNSYEFTQLILAQPVKRKTLLLSQYFGVCIALTCSVLIGIGIPVFLFSANAGGFLLLGGSVILSLTFVSLAFFSSVFSTDKSKGIGISILFWFYFVFIYDAIVLAILFSLSDYPIEKFILGLSFLNPVDMVRIVLIMQIDSAAIMGYTGAIFNDLLGSSQGIIICLTVLSIWVLIPIMLSLRKFSGKDI